MHRFGLGLAVGAVLVAAACTGDDPPFNSSGGPGDGGASSSGSTSSSSSGGSSSGADVFVDPGGPFVTTFGNNGTLALPKAASAMGVAPGGEVVWVSGTDPDSESLLQIHRLDPNGSPDATGLQADLILGHEDGNQREVATAAGFGKRGPGDYVFIIGGRGDTSSPSSETRAPDVWLRGYATRDKVSTSRVQYSPGSTEVDNVVAVAYGPNADNSNGHVYGAWTNGAQSDPSAYVVANGNVIKIDDHAIAGGVSVDADKPDYVYGVARSISPSSPKQLHVIRANGIAVTLDPTWNSGQPLLLQVQADITSANVVALEAGKIAVGGTAGDQLIVSVVAANGSPPAPPPPLATIDVKPIVNAMLLRGPANDPVTHTSKILFAGCIGDAATSRGWIAQVSINDSGTPTYDPSFGEKGQHKFLGQNGDCIKAMGLDESQHITVLISGPQGGRIHKLTL